MRIALVALSDITLQIVAARARPEHLTPESTKTPDYDPQDEIHDFYLFFEQVQGLPPKSGVLSIR